MSVIFLDGVNKGKAARAYAKMFRKYKKQGSSIITLSLVRVPESIFADDGKSTTKYVNRLNKQTNNKKGAGSRMVMGSRKAP